MKAAGESRGRASLSGRAESRWTIGRFAALGLSLAVAFFIYAQSGRGLEGPTPAWSRPVVTTLCPGSLLFSTVDIDVRPHTAAFNEMWLIIATANSAIYALIGVVLVLFRRLRQKVASG